jgi:hypothetical protein
VLFRQIKGSENGVPLEDLGRALAFFHIVNPLILAGGTALIAFAIFIGRDAKSQA